MISKLRFSLILFLVLAESACQAAATSDAARRWTYSDPMHSVSRIFLDEDSKLIAISPTAESGRFIFDDGFQAFISSEIEFAVPVQVDTLRAGDHWEFNGVRYVVKKAPDSLNALGEVLSGISIVMSKEGFSWTYFFSRTNGLMAIAVESPEGVSRTLLSEQRCGFGAPTSCRGRFVD